MATTEEIRRRVEQADIERSARRSAAAQQVGELARRRAAVAAQLTDVERELGDVLAAAQDVIDLDELARFTDLKTVDLTQWLTTRTPRRGRPRKQTSNGTSNGHAVRGRPASQRTRATRQEAAPPNPSGPTESAARGDAQVR